MVFLSGQVFGAILGAIVSIQVEPAPHDDVGETLATSCSAVFGEVPGEGDACVIDGDDSAGYSVRVTWSSDAGGLRARIEVSSKQREETSVRGLAFDSQSDGRERWEAIGLVIAAMVNADLAASPAPAIDESKAEPPPQAPEPPATEEPKAPSTFFIAEAGGLLQSLGSSHVSYGGQFRGSLSFGIPLEPTLSFGASTGARPLRHLSLRPSLGLRYWVIQGPVGVGLSAEGVVSTTKFTATREEKTESAWKTRYGAALGGLVSVPVGRSWGLSGAGAATLLAPPVHISVENQLLAEIDLWGFEASLSFWWRI